MNSLYGLKTTVSSSYLKIMNYFLSLQKVFNNPNNKNARIKTLGKLLLWKLNQIFLHFPVIIQLTPEMKCICHPDSSFSSLIVYTRFPEYFEMNLLHNILEKDDIFVDVGANIGSYTLIASSKIKTGKIFSFEPSPVSFEYLKENIQLNNLSNIVITANKVVSDKNGSVEFILGKHSETNRIKVGSNETLKTKAFPSVTLDSFLVGNNISHVDIMKIDVEGAELRVLRGFEGYLKNNKAGMIILEMNPNCKEYGYSVEDTASFLTKFGFSLYLIEDNGRIRKLEASDFHSKRSFNTLAINETGFLSFRNKKRGLEKCIKNYFSTWPR